MKIVMMIFSFSILLLTSCQDNTPVQVIPIPGNTSFLGTWVYSNSTDTLMVLAKSPSLQTDKYGFSFKANGQFIERKNNGWCGTPPITLADFNGTWSDTTGQFLEISVAYWGGTE